MHVSAWIGLDAEDGDILSFTKWNELVAYIDTKVDISSFNNEVSTLDVKIDTKLDASQIVTDGAGDKFLSDDGTYIELTAGSSTTYSGSLRPYLSNTSQSISFSGSGDVQSITLNGYGFQPGMVFDLPSDDYSQDVEISSFTQATIDITSLKQESDLQDATFASHFPDSVVFSFQTVDVPPQDDPNYDPNNDYVEEPPFAYTSPYSTWQAITESEYNDLRGDLVIRGHTTSTIESVNTWAYTGNYGTMSKTESQKVSDERIIYAIRFRATNANQNSTFSLGLANSNGVVEKVASNSVSHTTTSGTRPYVYMAGPWLYNDLGAYKYLVIANTGWGLATTDIITKTNYGSLSGSTITIGRDLDTSTYAAAPYEILTN